MSKRIHMYLFYFTEGCFVLQRYWNRVWNAAFSVHIYDTVRVLISIKSHRKMVTTSLFIQHRHTYNLFDVFYKIYIHKLWRHNTMHLIQYFTNESVKREVYNKYGRTYLVKLYISICSIDWCSLVTQCTCTCFTRDTHSFEQKYRNDSWSMFI